MRFGICTGPENLDLLENLGYDYIEMNVTSVMKLTPEEQDHYRRKVEQSKVKCEAFNVLFPKTMELVGGSTGEKELRNYLKEAMTLIQSFGASLVVFGSGKVRRCPPDLTLGEGYQKLVRVYQITGEIASDYGIQVVIEPLSRGGDKSDQSAFRRSNSGVRCQYAKCRVVGGLLSYDGRT